MISKEIEQSLSKSSLIRKMFEEGKRMKKLYGEENVFDFSIGNPSLQPPKELLDSLVEHAPEDNIHRYMLNAGYEDVREKVAQFHNQNTDVKLNMNNVIMSVGAAGGINVVLKAILNPEDEVIVLSPYFVDYLFYIKNYQGVPVIVKTLKDTFQLDLDAIKSALTHKTKAIILNSPNNPTGVIYPRADLEKLAEILKAHEKKNHIDVAVLSDEPYNQINYDVEVPNLLNIFDNVLIVNSFSKSLSLPGARIGYILISPNLKDFSLAVSAMIFATRTLGFINAPALYQKAIADSLYVPADKEHYRKMRDSLVDIISSAGFDYVKPEGTFYLFAKSPIPNDMEFAEIAKKYRILVVPGTGFGCPGYFRMSYCGDIQTIINSREAFMQLGKEFNL